MKRLLRLSFHHVDRCHYQEQAIPSLSLLMCLGVFIPQEWTEFCFTSINDWLFSFHFSRSLSPADNKNIIMRQFLIMVTMPRLFVVPSYEPEHPRQSISLDSNIHRGKLQYKQTLFKNIVVSLKNLYTPFILQVEFTHSFNKHYQ